MSSPGHHQRRRGHTCCLHRRPRCRSRRLPRRHLREEFAGLRKQPNIPYVEQNLTRAIAGIPDDTDYAQQWSLPEIDWDQAYVPDVTITPTETINAGFSDGDTDTDTDGKLDVGETWLYTGSYAITQVDIDAGTLHNVASAAGEARGGDPTDPTDDITDSDFDDEDLPQNASIDLVKENGTFTDDNGDAVADLTDGDGIAQLGELITYDLSVENDGNVTITGLTVTDPNVTVTTVDADEDGALDVGETWLCTGVYAINQTDIDATTFHIVA